MKKQIYIVEIDMPDGDLVSSGWLQELIQQDLDSEGDKNRQTVSVREISLPSGLDEAAIQAHIRLEEGEGLSFLNIFKAGAQWRDAQIPKLPDSIDEAAIQAHIRLEEGEGLSFLNIFKAGAEWMAGQGHTVDGTFHHSCGYPSVIELKTYLRDYEGADVIVTIRKK